MVAEPSQVKAFPTKAFFTTNLTKDIELQHAILDLLDNCVDGITRQNLVTESRDRPYDGFWAKITFDISQFVIEDNCGGIPPGIAYEHAFVFGRDPRRGSSGGTVGVYGIGMKRAIFKMGRHAKVVSQHDATNSLTVEVPEAWESESRWEFPCVASGRILAEPGTKICVSLLHNSISADFANRKQFQHLLVRAIKQHYGFIIAKGFGVTVNGVAIGREDFKLLVPKSLLASSNVMKIHDQIMPYIFSGIIDEVQVNFVCGFYAPIQSAQGDESLESLQRSSDSAGWTICCNDRVVVYNDKTELTGWGTGGVPRYHGQFRTFTGLVRFEASDPSLLPMQTTKRGVDGSSRVFLQVREYMRVAMGSFTSFTNKWKTDVRVDKLFAGTELALLNDIQERSDSLMRKLRNKETLRAYNPSLPVPPSENPSRQIKYNKTLRQIKTVAKFLDVDSNNIADVGARSFDYVYDRARR